MEEFSTQGNDEHPAHLRTTPGWIEVIAGSMFSGKSEELIRRLRRARIARQRVQVFKPEIDVRFSKDHIVSHSEMRHESVSVKTAAEIRERVNPATQVVGIDEAQFFDQELVSVSSELADRGVRVIIAGLDQDYTGRPFEPMPQLLAVAEYITKTHAICVRCGQPANHSQRIVEVEGRVVVGAGDAYEARCRRCFVPHADRPTSSLICVMLFAALNPRKSDVRPGLCLSVRRTFFTMRLWKSPERFFALALAALAALGGAACQQGTTNTANTANTTNASANTANANAAANTNAGAAPASSIAAREPEKYTARIVFSGQAAGQSQKIEVPLEVARNGADRRYAITLPVGQIIFLDRADKRYIIMPAQKQYAELTPEVTGFDVRSLTPVQMVAQLEKMQGVEQVGEETINGRAALKYRAAARANTASQAGQVATENLIYIDKETGLPLKWEGYGQSSGNVQGVNNVRIVAETKEIKTDVDPTLFEVPQNMRKITPEELKRYADMVAGLLGMVLNNINAQSGAAPTAAPSPSPAATR